MQKCISAKLAWYYYLYHNSSFILFNQKIEQIQNRYSQELHSIIVMLCITGSLIDCAGY